MDVGEPTYIKILMNFPIKHTIQYHDILHLLKVREAFITGIFCVELQLSYIYFVYQTL